MTHEAERGDRQAQPRGRRGLWIALIVSLTVNLLFVGVIAGAAWARWHLGWMGPRHFSFSQSVERLIGELPDERRPVAENVLKSYTENVRPMWREVGAARQEVLDALKADQFERARARTAFDQLFERQMDARSQLSRHMLDLMEELSAEERQAFLGNFGQRRRGRRK